MADPLSYKSSGFPQRTPRTQARAHGAKVPPMPSEQGYCGRCGCPHEGACTGGGKDPIEAASGGGTEKAAPSPVPFKLGG